MKLTKRGKVVLGVAIALGLWGLWEVATHVLWVGNGWRWCDDLLTCSK
jgi:hypothetical protein